jgi:hypothetical protein
MKLKIYGDGKRITADEAWCVVAPMRYGEFKATYMQMAVVTPTETLTPSRALALMITPDEAIALAADLLSQARRMLQR